MACRRLCRTTVRPAQQLRIRFPTLLVPCLTRIAELVGYYNNDEFKLQRKCVLQALYSTMIQLRINFYTVAVMRDKQTAV